MHNPAVAVDIVNELFFGQLINAPLPLTQLMSFSIDTKQCAPTIYTVNELLLRFLNNAPLPFTESKKVS